LIAGGLYSVTALRKVGAKVTVYARHLETGETDVEGYTRGAQIIFFV
jgi:glyoxylate carboligase